MIDIVSGQASLVTNLMYNFGTVGIELHPSNDTIYACSNGEFLLSIDPDTGVVTEIGPMGLTGACDNLAAPWQPVPCLDNFMP